MRCVRTRIWRLAIVTALGAAPALVEAQMAPSFTFQGQLKDSGAPVSGLVYLEFSLWDEDVGGVQVGSAYWAAGGVNAADGLFTAEVDATVFGVAAFNGDPRWLEVTVTDSMGANPVVLSPRQPLTPAPYALYALDGAGSLWTADPNDPNNGISYTAGYVGVGEQYPWAPLTVVSPGGGEAIAVENWADGTSARLGGSSYGVSATTYSPDSAGVYGSNLSSGPGLCIGVWGRATNPDGYAGYFDGRGYFTDDVGIGRIPTAKLDVAGALKADGFQLTDTPVAGHVLTCDASGVGTWQAAGGGSSLWTADPNNGISYQSGNVGIGASSWPSTRLLVDNAEAYTIRARNRSTSGTSIAVYAEGDSTSARAVFADATATSGEAVGVFGRSQSPVGYGVWGHNGATEITSKPIGVYGSADSARGVGVKGYVAGTQGVGIWARADGASSHAMMAEAIATSGTTFGLEAYATSPDGYGVYSFNEAESGDAIAIYGETGSPSGIALKGATWAPDGYAIYGLNGASSGNAVGGYFKTNSPQGSGVRAEAASALSGYAGYFVGRGYFSNNVGIGTASPGSPLTVAGLVESTSGGFKYPDGTIQTTAGGGGASLWQQNGDEIYYDTDNVGVGISNPQSTLHVAGGNWDVATTEGDFKIGSSTYRLKMGVALDGGGAGACRIFAGGPSSKLILGANATDVLTVTNSDVDIDGPLAVDGFQLTTAPTAGYVLTCDSSGNGTWQAPSGGGSFNLPYSGTISSNGPAFKLTNNGSDPNTCAGWFESSAQFGKGFYGLATGYYATGIKAEASGTDATALGARATGANGIAVSARNDSPDQPAIVASNHVGGPLFVGKNSSSNTVFEVTNDGTTITNVLQIQGGADLSEQFDVQAAQAEPLPGMVVCIDPANPGKLIVSTTAYDRKVAGIVSGAGGVTPGMLMGQNDSIADGQFPVALTGRVYVRADASGGPIVPGDLLTTSGAPGHAMKVADHAKAQGAIIGKAMTPLASGDGLVLVLVSLQ